MPQMMERLHRRAGALAEEVFAEDCKKNNLVEPAKEKISERLHRRAGPLGGEFGKEFESRPWMMRRQITRNPQAHCGTD